MQKQMTIRAHDGEIANSCYRWCFTSGELVAVVDLQHAHAATIEYFGIVAPTDGTDAIGLLKG